MWLLALSFLGATIIQLVGLAWLKYAQWYGYLMPWALFFLIPISLAAVINKKYWLAVLLSCSILYIISAYAANFLPQSFSGPDDRLPTVNVMSFNAWSKNRDTNAIEELISNHSPDVLFIQEITQDVYSALASQVKKLRSDESTYYSTYDPQNMLAIVSIFKPREISRIGAGRTKIQRATVTIQGKDVTIFNVHFLRGPWDKRIKDIRLFVDNAVTTESGPVLLGGDLNATSQTLIYQLVSGPLINSHETVGFGFGFTYPSGVIKLWDMLAIPPLVRIDHIFHSAHFRSISTKTIPIPAGSDHLPIISELSIKYAKLN